MIKILFIAPYQGLAQLATQIAQQYYDFETRVEVGNLEEGLILSQKAEKEGYSIILSRGGTADFLAEHAALPVLSIPLSGYDVLRSVSLAQNFSGKKAVVGFDSITRGYKAVNMLLHTDMEIITIQNKDEVMPILKTLKAQDVTSIIGDVVTVNCAKALGLNGMLITSGEESVRDAMDQIKPYLKQIDLQKQKARIFEQILSSLPQVQVYAFDENKNLIFPTDSQTDPVLQDYLVGQIPTVTNFGTSSGIAENGRHICYRVEGNAVFLEQGDRITVFSAVAMEGCITGQIGITVCSIPAIKDISYNLYDSRHAACHEMMTRIRTLSKTDVPILLEGECGTGKKELGLLLHKEMSGTTQSVIILNCDSIESDGIRALFENGQLVEQGKTKLPLLLLRLDSLKPACQAQLLHYQALFCRFRMIATAQRSIEDMVKTKDFTRELFYAFGFSSVWLPPLRKHKEDIENLSSIIISQENEKLGKQVVGLAKDALEAFSQYDWPRNIAQLRDILHEAVKATDAPFIAAGMVCALLSRPQEARNSVVDFSVGKTLEDIEREIIQAVLYEENMNQSRAAERLGISRTTFWRKLKQ